MARKAEGVVAPKVDSGESKTRFIKAFDEANGSASDLALMKQLDDAIKRGITHKMTAGPALGPPPTGLTWHTAGATNLQPGAINQIAGEYIPAPGERYAERPALPPFDPDKPVDPQQLARMVHGLTQQVLDLIRENAEIQREFGAQAQRISHLYLDRNMLHNTEEKRAAEAERRHIEASRVADAHGTAIEGHAAAIEEITRADAGRADTLTDLAAALDKALDRIDLLESDVTRLERQRERKG